MKFTFPTRIRPFAAAAALLLAVTSSACALEMRTWLKLDGTMLEAELVRSLGADVELRDKDGRIIKLPKVQLSFADIDYINENAPPDKTSSIGATTTGAKPKVPVPAKSAKVDTKAFKKDAGLFKIKDNSYKVCETPHFKIMYLKPTDPMDMAELAERLWLETACFHSTFIPKWHDRKMAILIVNSDEAYNDVGSWYADMLVGDGKDPEKKDLAERLRKTWPESAAGNLNLPSDVSDQHKVLPRGVVFRGMRKVQKYANGPVTEEMVKGVWDPFRTHCVAEALLEVQAGGVSGFAEDGQVAIFTGHAFYKEIQLTDKVGTNLLKATGTGKDVSAAKGFDKIEGKAWAGELKKRIRKGGEWAPDLTRLFTSKRKEISDPDIVFSYAFCRFLQNTPERLTAFNKLCRKIDAAHQVPGLDEIGQLYGYDDGKALEKAWIEWMDGGEFR